MVGVDAQRVLGYGRERYKEEVRERAEPGSQRYSRCSSVEGVNRSCRWLDLRQRRFSCSLISLSHCRMVFPLGAFHL